MKLKFAVLLSTVLTAGCVTSEPLRQIALDNNRLVARTADEQALLNVLRSKDRMKQHYTSFTQLRGNVTAMGDLGLNAEFLGKTRSFTQGQEALAMRADAVTNSKPDFGVSLTANPSFDAAHYDTKQFQQGILTPVKGEQIEYLLQQGWPEDFLTALLIGQITIELKHPTEDLTYQFVWKNHPTDDTISVRKLYSDLSRRAPSAERFRRLSGFSFGRIIDESVMVPNRVKGSEQRLVRVDELREGLSLADLEKLDGSKFDVKLSTEQETSESKKPNDESDPYIVRKKSSKPSVNLVLRGDDLLSDIIDSVDPVFLERKGLALALSPGEEDFSGSITIDIAKTTKFAITEKDLLAIGFNQLQIDETDGLELKPDYEGAEVHETNATQVNWPVKGPIFEGLRSKAKLSGANAGAFAARQCSILRAMVTEKVSIVTTKYNEKKDMIFEEDSADGALQEQFTKAKASYEAAKGVNEKLLKSCDHVTLSYSFSPRSPQGIMYFLGQYVRYDLEKPYEDCRNYKRPKIALGHASIADLSDEELKKRNLAKPKDAIGTTEPTFVTDVTSESILADYQKSLENKVYCIENGRKVISVQNTKDENALISVRYRGNWFSMPDPAKSGGAPSDPAHRGSQALALVQQLINLQKEANSLPVSSTIRLTP